MKGEQFIEFLKHAPFTLRRLNNPKDVAWFLASYARDAFSEWNSKRNCRPCKPSGPPWKKLWG